MIFDFSFEFKDVEKEEKMKLSHLIDADADETCALFIEFSQDLFQKWWEVTEIDHSCILYKLSR